ncbi:carboxylesterase family protein, partial [Streptomyces erythrochromogenes]|uniref:carboxylesterase family protein n=1 Tax=Streptomyces erythrochromogenes TaxID=285574 RepID=UPI0036900304
MPHSPGQDHPEVQLPAGRLRGATEGGVAVFRAVPYAAPPVGDLRWRPAQPHPGWSGTRDAAADGPSAPQMYAEGADPGRGRPVGPPGDRRGQGPPGSTPPAGAAPPPGRGWLHGG